MTGPDGIDRRAAGRILAAAALTGFGARAAHANPLEPDAMATTQLACDAFLLGDIAAIERLLRPDFTQVNSSGSVQYLPELLDEVRRGDTVYAEFRNHDMSALFVNDVAIVRGVTSLRGTHLGAPFALDVRFTDILERGAGYWRMVTTHVTRLPENAPRRG